jgi:hypothetical protein
VVLAGVFLKKIVNDKIGNNPYVDMMQAKNLTIAPDEESKQKILESDDAKALINAFSKIDYTWRVRPLASSAKGDNIFVDAGSDLKDFYMTQDKNTVYIKLDVFDTLNDELAYEFYLNSRDVAYQIRIIPYWRIYLWKRSDGKVEPYKTDGLRVENSNNYIELSLSKKAFMFQNFLKVRPAVFNIKLYNQTGGRNTVVTDFVQFSKEFEIKI